RVQIGPEAHDQRQPAGKRPASVAMIVQPARNQKESNSRAIERAQVPARTQHANGCQESQGNPVPANAFLSQSYRQQEQRSGNRNRLEKLQAPEAERGPDGPKDHLVESFEFGHLLAGERISERFDRPKRACLYNLLPGADLPGEIQVGKGNKVIRQKENDQKKAEKVRPLPVGEAFRHGDSFARRKCYCLGFSVMRSVFRKKLPKIVCPPSSMLMRPHKATRSVAGMSAGDTDVPYHW